MESEGDASLGLGPHGHGPSAEQSIGVTLGSGRKFRCPGRTQAWEHVALLGHPEGLLPISLSPHSFLLPPLLSLTGVLRLKQSPLDLSHTEQSLSIDQFLRTKGYMDLAH